MINKKKKRGDRILIKDPHICRQRVGCRSGAASRPPFQRRTDIDNMVLKASRSHRSIPLKTKQKNCLWNKFRHHEVIGDQRLLS